MPLVAVSLLPSACFDPCENTVVSEIPSPDRARRAVIFERGCGATTATGVNVAVLKSGEPLPSTAGNAFIADSGHGAAKDMTVTVRWTAPDRLLVRYPARARVFTQETVANGIAVVYEAVP